MEKKGLEFQIFENSRYFYCYYAHPHVFFLISFLHPNPTLTFLSPSQNEGGKRTPSIKRLRLIWSRFAKNIS